jgi:hypothetical protein
MSTLRRLTILLSLVMTIALLAAPAAAKDKTVTIVDDDGQTYICTYIEGERIRVVNQDTGEEVMDFDVEDLEDTIEEAMEEVEEALEELEGLDIDLHIGDDSFLRMELGDERVFVDVDAIIEGVMEAVEHLDDIDFGDLEIGDVHFDRDHDSRHVYMKHAHEDREDIEDELEELRDEIRELKRELRKAKRSDRH